jgi:hypothetical protein
VLGLAMQYGYVMPGIAQFLDQLPADEQSTADD